jgi:hypothetical protein
MPPAKLAASSASPRAEMTRKFEAIADAILYRWAVERDTWVSSTEVAEARAYLERQGIVTKPLPDGRFALGDVQTAVLGGERVVLLGLRRLRGRRDG